MRMLPVVILSIVLSACAAGYQVGEITDRFSDPNGPRVVSMRGNSIDFSDPLGIVKTSEFNGFAATNRGSGKIEFVGFFYLRSVDSTEVAFSSLAKWLSVRQGDEAVFLADGERIILRATGRGKIDHLTTGGGGQGVSTRYFEDVTYQASAADFRKIAYAKSLEFKINGSNGSAVYPSGGRPILQSFQENIRKFYESEIAPKL